MRGFSSSGGLQGIQRVLVVGSGQMGSGIAQVCTFPCILLTICVTYIIIFIMLTGMGKSEAPSSLTT